MKYITLTITIIFILSCKTDNNTCDKHQENNFDIKKVESKSEQKISKYSSLIKPSEVSYLHISNGSKTDSIIMICNCEKNKFDNSLTVQLRSAIPTKREINLGVKNSNLIVQNSDYKSKLNGQYKFLTLKLKGNIVEYFDLYSKSTSNDYGQKDYQNLEVKIYDVKLSTFDYSVATDVYGSFEIELPEDFGYFQNDKILKGKFKCNNWKTLSKSDVQNWQINKVHEVPVE